MSGDLAPTWRDDTITGFPAIRDDTEIIPAPGDPCTCGMCPSSAEPGKDALLSCAPGVTSRIWRTWISQGKWDDIASLFDDAHASVHKPALKELRRIHADLAARRHDFAAVFSRNPGLLPDRALAGELRGLEATLEGRLEDMRREAAGEEARIAREEQARAGARAVAA